MQKKTDHNNIELSFCWRIVFKIAYFCLEQKLVVTGKLFEFFYGDFRCIPCSYIKVFTCKPACIGCKTTGIVQRLSRCRENPTRLGTTVGPACLGTPNAAASVGGGLIGSQRSRQGAPCFNARIGRHPGRTPECERGRRHLAV